MNNSVSPCNYTRIWFQSLFVIQLQYYNVRVVMTLSKRAKLWRTIKNNNMLKSYVQMNK